VTPAGQQHRQFFVDLSIVSAYGGALIIHLVALSLLALWLMRYLPEAPARPAERLTFERIRTILLIERWNLLVTGALVGVVGIFAYLRVAPLGVTTQLGSITRTALATTDWLPERLYGLDTLAGCATAVIQTVTENGWLILGLMMASLAMALLGNRFRPTRLTTRNSATALLGGVLMGWGAMTALGCTVGALLSGISAFGLSGWVFTGAMVAGVWFGIRVGLAE
jgi:hypothetical protein